MDDLPLPVHQVIAGDGPEVQLGRRLKQQLGGGRDTRRNGAGNPGAQAVETRLQLGP